MQATRNTPYVTFVIVAEFDIKTGGAIAHQYPHATGIDEQVLADEMLPEGCHSIPEDWSIFFLNQCPANTTVPFTTDTSQQPPESNNTKPMYCLSLVRTKLDSTVDRGAKFKALAIATHIPYFQIFKPILLIALDEYYKNPTEATVKEIYDTLNSLDLSMVPPLTRHEKLVMRLSDRKDLFADKFARRSSREVNMVKLNSNAPNSSATSITLNGSYEVIPSQISRSKSATSLKHHHHRNDSEASGGLASDMSHNSSSSAVWVGDDGQQDSVQDSSLASEARAEGVRSHDDLVTGSSDSGHLGKRKLPHRDTHIYETTINYANIPIPVKIPVSAFAEEVGDYSLSVLIKYFSSGNTQVIGPMHPHLHTNGSQTHPVMIIFNAIITHKRVIFMGHGKTAASISNFVLAACALASGSGCFLRGFIERAFPYMHLSAQEMLEALGPSGYIAGVLNPIFESLPVWDVLCNVVTNTITIHKDIAAPAPAPSLFPVPPTMNPLQSRTNVRTDGSYDDEFGRVSGATQGGATQRADITVRPDSYDVLFMEDIQASIANHISEAGLRARFAEYVYRFLQLASRYEEDTQRMTCVGYPCSQYTYNNRTGQGSLGSGLRFSEEVAGLREVSINAARIEGWRKSPSYEYWVQDFQNLQETNPIQGFDLEHQILRLRNGKSVPDGEVALILKTLCENVRSYDQVVELLSHCQPQHGGLQPIAIGLFHQQEYIRDMTVGLLNVIRDYTVGFQFLQSLNQFLRYSYIRQVYERQPSWHENLPQETPNANGSELNKAPSNHSQVSLGTS